jgi:hypothetical protein
MSWPQFTSDWQWRNRKPRKKTRFPVREAIEKGHAARRFSWPTDSVAPDEFKSQLTVDIHFHLRYFSS